MIVDQSNTYAIWHSEPATIPFDGFA
jgi:hypothetical protein